METEIKKAVSSPLDKLKWLIVVVLLGGIAAGNYLYFEVSLLFRVLGALGLCLVAGGIAYTTAQGQKVFKLALQARLELSRVIWPTRPELMQTFAAVLLVVGIVVLLLWVMDSVFSWMAFALLG